MKIDAMKTAAAVTVVAVTVAAMTVAAAADDAGLQLPADLTAAETAPGQSTEPADAPRGIQYRETRIGGRLERVTITRENGWTETYRNNRADTIWSAPSSEIGERANMRRWVIRAW